MIKKLSNAQNNARQEVFNLWLTDETNKEDGGTYDWSQLKLALKRINKNAPIKSTVTTIDDGQQEEEGELEEGEYDENMTNQNDENAAAANDEGQDQMQGNYNKNRNNKQQDNQPANVEMHVI